LLVIVRPETFLARHHIPFWAPETRATAVPRELVMIIPFAELLLPVQVIVSTAFLRGARTFVLLTV
jgi:hypothetical protein